MENIGVRAAKEVYKRIDSEHSIDDLADEIDCSSALFWYWRRRKHIPSGKILRNMALAGYDVYYILTGEKT
jgi:hypothetical protein